VVDDQLAAAVEQLAQRLRAALALERVLLTDQLPGELAPLAAQLVAQPRELLLPGEVLPPCFDPRVVPNYPVLCHFQSPHWSPAASCRRAWTASAIALILASRRCLIDMRRAAQGSQRRTSPNLLDTASFPIWAVAAESPGPGQLAEAGLA
jgi:hypothetical protein